MSNDAWTPVTYETCHGTTGPFYHGTRSELEVGDFLVTGQPSNFEGGRVSNHLYFTATLEIATLGAELAVALAQSHGGPGYVYQVEPTGAFEDDPNVTNKRFPGNPTRSYRTRESLRIIGIVRHWERRPPEVLQQMLESLDRLRQQGLAVIED